MPRYINKTSHDLHFAGPDNVNQTIRRGREVRLPEYFDKYIKIGKFEKITDGQTKIQLHRPSKTIIPPSKQSLKMPNELKRNAAKRNVITKKINNKSAVVGRESVAGVQDAFTTYLNTTSYPISNGIGVGILSYNRPHSLKRLINSILAHTDLNSTTIFISDDNSTDKELLDYLESLKSSNIVVINNTARLGVAGNSNRLLRCLSRFPQMLLLNDDVEILSSGWDKFYFRAMTSTGFCHFCHREAGVYGAKQGDVVSIDGVKLSMVDIRPQGAILAMSHVAFGAVGFFDEKFGEYGIEHVDWSTRLSKSGLQSQGYYDVVGSSDYFKVHSDMSMVHDRVKLLNNARDIYDKMPQRPTRIEASDNTIVPRISYVIPFREIERRDSILTVINNIRAQKFPDIEVVLVEHDSDHQMSPRELAPSKYHFVRSDQKKPFNKSIAFNIGVSNASNETVILHDADILVNKDYTCKISDILEKHESCHIGAHVYYADENSTTHINTHKKVANVNCTRRVDYFEGGSLACKTDVYWNIGAFNEDFWGYGVEDCEFYYRLKNLTKMFCERTENFLHLLHGRTTGWHEFHEINKRIDKGLLNLSLPVRVSNLRDKLLKGVHAKHIK